MFDAGDALDVDLPVPVETGTEARGEFAEFQGVAQYITRLDRGPLEEPRQPRQAEFVGDGADPRGPLGLGQVLEPVQFREEVARLEVPRHHPEALQCAADGQQVADDTETEVVARQVRPRKRHEQQREKAPNGVDGQPSKCRLASRSRLPRIVARGLGRLHAGREEHEHCRLPT